jgi:hypothetical protein
MGKCGLPFYQIECLIKLGRKIKKGREKKANGVSQETALKIEIEERQHFYDVNVILTDFPGLSIRIDALMPYIYNDDENRQLQIPVNK